MGMDGCADRNLNQSLEPKLNAETYELRQAREDFKTTVRSYDPEDYWTCSIHGGSKAKDEGPDSHEEGSQPPAVAMPLI